MDIIHKYKKNFFFFNLLCYCGIPRIKLILLIFFFFFFLIYNLLNNKILLRNYFNESILFNLIYYDNFFIIVFNFLNLNLY